MNSNGIIWTNYKQSEPIDLHLIAGHYHSGGYAVDSHGIHHITLHGVIESQPDCNTFAIAEVTEDCLTVKGHGRIQNCWRIPLSRN